MDNKKIELFIEQCIIMAALLIPTIMFFVAGGAGIVLKQEGAGTILCMLGVVEMTALTIIADKGFFREQNDVVIQWKTKTKK